VLNTAALILVLAALGGLTMASLRLSGRPLPPTWLALGHGAIAATGLVLVAREAFIATLPGRGNLALGCIAAAAVGGLIMFFGFHRKGRPLPIPFVLGHGLLALTGVILLWTSLP
jgi:hypothetical protein